MSRTLVNLESPYAGDIERNTVYAQFCMHDSIVNHNEAPFASHLLYTQPHILNEHIPEERALGIATGLEFTRMTEKTVIYTDLGVTKGMEQAIESAERNGVEVEMRKLNNNDWELFFHDTTNFQKDSGRVVWSEPEPVMPKGRIINEDSQYLKYMAWVIPLALLTVIAFGIADSVGWFG